MVPRDILAGTLGAPKYLFYRLRGIEIVVEAVAVTALGPCQCSARKKLAVQVGGQGEGHVSVGCGGKYVGAVKEANDH